MARREGRGEGRAERGVDVGVAEGRGGRPDALPAGEASAIQLGSEEDSRRELAAREAARGDGERISIKVHCRSRTHRSQKAYAAKIAWLGKLTGSLAWWANHVQDAAFICVQHNADAQIIVKLFSYP